METMELIEEMVKFAALVVGLFAVVVFFQIGSRLAKLLKCAERIEQSLKASNEPASVSR